MTSIFKWILLVFVSICIGIFFSYKITEVPRGLTIDESAFGYNAILLAETYHDQNGRFLPFFVLSINGKDWRQPVTQYYMAAFFKVFGASIFNLRFTSVLVTITSTLLLFYFTKQLINKNFAIVACLVFLTTPLIMIQSHLALDNIMPIPFTIGWLFNLFLFQKTKKYRYLFLAGICLGIGFYTYKGMRATVPAWTILTIIYLGIEVYKNQQQDKLKNFIKQSLMFGLGILPFYAIIPLLQIKYANAVFDNQSAKTESLYTFLYPYFSSYDLSFLYISGDTTLFHSTGKHGMMLLATLPIFILGCYQSIKKHNFSYLILLAFITAPILYGFPNSVHRASRLMVMIPLYALICTYGVIFLWEKRKSFPKIKILLAVFIMVAGINYFEFVSYYWNEYPNNIRYLMDHLSKHESYRALDEESKKRKLTPYISTKINDGEDGHLFEVMYFHKLLPRKEANMLELPADGIILSDQEILPPLKTLDLGLPSYYIQVH